jgi:hypothetical protein
LPPTRWVGESGRQFRMALFQFAQLAHQGVVFGVADLGLVENVIEALMPAQFLAQFLHFRPGIFHGTLNYNLNEARGEKPSPNIATLSLYTIPGPANSGAGMALGSRAVAILEKTATRVRLPLPPARGRPARSRANTLPAART